MKQATAIERLAIPEKVIREAWIAGANVSWLSRPDYAESNGKSAADVYDENPKRHGDALRKAYEVISLALSKKVRSK